MYTYNYRLFDRYNRRVASLAVLGDDNPVWRPSEFGYTLFGCRASLEFPTVKLLDYAPRWEELAASRNPFAVVVLAHLKTLATHRDAPERLRWKLNLIRSLYEGGVVVNVILHRRWAADGAAALGECTQIRREIRGPPRSSASW